MYRKDVYPASRAEAYNMMAHMAQDMCNEVDYSEQLRIEKRDLMNKIEKLEKEFKLSKENYDTLYNTVCTLRAREADYKEKYYELLKECKPDEYKMISGEESDEYEYDEDE